MKKNISTGWTHGCSAYLNTCSNAKTGIIQEGQAMAMKVTNSYGKYALPDTTADAKTATAAKPAAKITNPPKTDAAKPDRPENQTWSTRGVQILQTSE